MTHRVCIIDVDDDCSAPSVSIASTTLDVGDTYCGIWEIDGEFEPVNGTVVQTISLESESETEACREAHQMWLAHVDGDDEPEPEPEPAPHRSEIDGVIQEDIVDGLQTVSGVGPMRALAMVGQVNATKWSDLLDDDNKQLRDSVEDAITHNSVDEDTVEIVVLGKVRQHEEAM